jgi:hypothetical protein
MQRMAKSRRPGRKTPVEEELSRLAGLEAGWEPHPPAQVRVCGWWCRDAGLR